MDRLLNKSEITVGSTSTTINEKVCVPQANPVYKLFYFYYLFRNYELFS